MSNDMTLLDIMKSAVVIPVIAIDDPDHAVPLAKALVAGGIRVLEVTLRTKHGLEAIRAMSQVEGAIVGVGTLTQPEELAASRNAGAVSRKTRQHRAIPEPDGPLMKEPLAVALDQPIVVVTGEAQGVRGLAAALGDESERLHRGLLAIAFDQ